MSEDKAFQMDALQGEAFQILEETINNIVSQRQQYEADVDQALAIEAEAESYDRAVRIRVNAQGALLDIHLGPSTSKMSRSQLARLITETAQAATQNATDMAHRYWEGTLKAQAQIKAAIAEEVQRLGVHVAEPTPRATPQAPTPTPAPIDDFSTPVDEFAPPPVDFAAPPTAYIAEQPSPQRSPWQKPRADAARPGEDDEDAHYDRFNQNPFGRH